ncbi:MAG: hypothetical protein KBT57_03370 [bacterium]|nr:hypothetical protein [Candidatus Limimorpha equi]
MTVSSTSKPMTGGENAATLYFSNSNLTSSAGTGVVSGTGASSVTIDASSLNLNTGYITASGAVRIWNIETTYLGTPSTDPAINADDEVNLAYNETSGSISYTISNPVDGVELEASLEEGITWITGLAAGDESVTFSTTANDSYDSRSAEITLSYEGAEEVVVTVNQTGKPVPTINADNVTIEQDATSGTIEYTIANPIEGQNLTAEITTGDWISNLAVDAENSQVTFDAAVNTGAARTATITLKYTGATDKVVSVTQKKFAVDYATLPFNWAGGGKSGLLALDGVTSNGLGSDYAELHAPYRIKFDNTGDYIQFKTNEAIGTITIGVKMIGGATASSITIQGSADGEEFTSTETLSISGEQNDIVNLETLNAIDASYRYVRLYFTRGSNVGVGPISIAKAETAYTVSIAQGIENGSISSVSPTSAIAGRTITIVPTPNDGYVLDHYTISKTEDGTDVTGIVDLDGNTFTMPAYNVTVSATFVVAEIHTVTIYDYIRHGSVTADKSRYAEGETVQLTATPEEGYALVEFNIWTEDYYDVDDIDINYNEETEYYEFTMPTFNIIVNASFAVIQTYTRITSIDQLTPGYPYLIVGVKDGTYYSMASQKSNNRDAVEINATETTATVTPTDAAHEFFLSGDPTNHYTFYDKADGSKGFLYAASSSSNYLKTQGTLDDNGKWSITFVENGEGEANIVALGTNSRNTMQYNSGSDLFSCYDEENNQSPVYLYKNDNPFPPEIFSNTTVEDLDITKGLIVNDYVRLEVTGGFIVDVNAPTPTDEEIQGIVEVGVTATPSVPLCLGHASQLVHNVGSPTGTIVKDIEHKYNSGSGRADWNTIACPLGINMLGGLWIGSSQEIYSYNEATHYWNIINETIAPATLGQGFIYGVPEEATYIRVSMIGTLPPNNVDKSFDLSYTEGLDALNGFNLVGNPFTCNAYVNMNYMVLNEEGSGFVNGDVIRPCDAILVQATGANQQITFSRNEFTQQNNRIDVSVSQNRGSVIDNARIRFGEGRGMNKFYLNENSTRLYIPQNGKDYAVVMANAAEGEMPVNFKAEKNGSYTITVNTENVDAEYLHLIDNKTGMDVDLLASTGSASYTFEAKTSDYASRFKLVFSMTGVEENASTSSVDFAYMSNGNLVIDNIEGEATLQIVDEIGRIISTETVSGSYNKALNLKAGLYIINLNGMTQKIVVK